MSVGRICKEYHVREKRERAYEEIENELEIDLNDIKTKIVGLRSQLGRELSKQIWRAFVF